jgi:hypothetical protein
MKRRRNVLREIRAQQRDPYRRKPLKPTAPFSHDRRQLSIDGLPPVRAKTIPSSETEKRLEAEARRAQHQRDHP